MNSRRNRQAKLKEKSIGCGVCGEGEDKYKCPKCRLPYCSVKCCKQHKEQCPAVQNTSASSKDKSTNSNERALGKSSSSCDVVVRPVQCSKYLSAEELTRDPLENARRRRKMLDEDEDEDLDQDGWRITREMMDCIDNSEWLRKELEDGGLRQIIAQIDMADDEANDSFSQRRQNKRPKLGAVPDLTPREIALMKAKQANPKFSNFVDRLLVTSKVLIEGEKTTEQEVASFLIGDGSEQVGMLALAPVERKRKAAMDNGILDENEDSDDSEDLSDEVNSTSSSES